jgi:predicted regulator of Ras-like GTPase activity (Roadblock/LC7/MglB family)
MLKQILNEFLSINGVATAAVIGRDGFVIEIVQVDPIDTDALGVLCSG